MALYCKNRMEIISIISASGSFSYAKSEFYKKVLKAYFKLCKNILSIHPSLKTSLHIFDYNVKPIFLYGSEILGIFSPYQVHK